MASIKQNLAGQPLPDFRNAGVMLRILLGVNLLALVAALVQSDRLAVTACSITCDMAAWVQPLLFFNLALLALLGKLLQRPAVWIGRTRSYSWPQGPRSCCRTCRVC
jgi:two-component system sensor histidine kinase AlgZ